MPTRKRKPDKRMAFIPIITLAEAKAYLKITSVNDDVFLQTVCDNAAGEIRMMLNRLDDADMTAVAGDESVKLVAKEMAQWRWLESRFGNARLGVSSVADSLASGGSATTSYQDMQARWRKRLMYLRYLPV